MEQSVIKTDFADLNLVARGKVRDIYDLGDALLLVATDRLSAFDVVLPDPIPRKGKVLNQISLYWFDVMKPIIANHVISGDVADYPAICQPYADILKERSMLVTKAKPLSIECIVRGYISGSGWNDYRKNGSVCGIQLPAGLTESERLPEPIFTPSTKAEMGSHDINIDFKTAAGEIGEGLADKVKDVSLAIYKKGAALALEKGLIIADTKFEFGLKDDELILIDEVLTPDSSRFWPQDSYLSGGAQKSYDKQYVRDYLLSVKWDKKPPAPSLPQEVIDNTQAKYSEALNRLTSDTDAV
ncbi:phosphoribosylaminoimidazolesuccinocarboxamide synthase [Desulfococcaceae bacterium HSG9]|nr:phosphoribosylaminoimidazolesuccinocarboxamide synthase [Desulfococcaceae bacterium HSG9]